MNTPNPYQGLVVQRLVPDGSIPRRLIEAAAQVFAAHGYAAARVRDIVRMADGNLAAVNYYFGGKEGLYATTLAELARSRLEQWTASDQAMADPEQQLREHVRVVLERVVGLDERSLLGRIIAHESMDPTPHFSRLLDEIVRPELERIAGIAKRLNPALDPERLKLLSLSIQGQCLFFLFARGALDRMYPEIFAAERIEALARHVSDSAIASILHCASP